jgi:hypothetical protein
MSAAVVSNSRRLCVDLLTGRRDGSFFWAGVFLGGMQTFLVFSNELLTEAGRINTCILAGANAAYLRRAGSQA